MDYFAHDKAEIDAGCRIGRGTSIWHFSHIMSGCQIGEECVIGHSVVISPGVVLGRNVKVDNNVSIYAGVACEDDVLIGPSAVFTNVSYARSFVERKEGDKPTTVRRGATIGANATIICGIEIGEYAMIGEGAVVRENVPAYALLYGVPARQHGWVSRNGHKLRFTERNEATCPETGEKYLLQSGKCVPLK